MIYDQKAGGGGGLGTPTTTTPPPSRVRACTQTLLKAIVLFYNYVLVDSEYDTFVCVYV